MRINNEVYGRTFTSHLWMDRGGGVVEHTHDPSSTHFTICLRGSCLFVEPGRNTLLRAGELYAPDEGVPHQIIGLEDGTEIMHINCQPIVEDWPGGVTEEFEGPHFSIPEGY